MHKSTVWRLVQTEQLPAIQLRGPGSTVRIDEQDSSAGSASKVVDLRSTTAIRTLKGREMLMPDCNCEELISLSKQAELVFGNAHRTDLAAQRCHQNRVNLVTRWRGQHPVHFVATADVPAFLCPAHRVLRGSGWRLELHQLRRRNTRALKERATRTSREARLQSHLERVKREVDENLARSGGPWRGRPR